MDSDEEEEARGITIDASNVSMIHEYGGQEYLINMIDTPGHVDFGGDVTRAMRAVDGAVVLVDAVEGTMPQTETVLRQALKEGVRPVLFINKVDRLINELKVDEMEMQIRLGKVIDKVNKLIKGMNEDAYNKGWKVQYFLVKLLQKNGLKYSDVQSVFLAPADARAAFERGAVDAWIIWDPFLAAAQKTLDARLLADATGVVNNRQYYFTSRDFATRNTDVLRIAIEEVNAIDTWASRNKTAAAAELSAVLGLDKSITELYLNRAQFGTAPVTRDILAEQQAIADTFFELKLIPKKLNLLHAAPVDLL
jgi:small GTP-binding protein